MKIYQTGSEKQLTGSYGFLVVMLLFSLVGAVPAMFIPDPVFLTLGVVLIAMVGGLILYVLHVMRATVVLVQLRPDVLMLRTIDGDFVSRWQDVKVTRYFQPDQRVPVYTIKAPGKTFYIWSGKGEFRELLAELRQRTGQTLSSKAQKYAVPFWSYWSKLIPSVVAAGLLGTICAGAVAALSTSPQVELVLVFGALTAVLYALTAPVVVCNSVTGTHDSITFGTLCGKTECAIDDIRSFYDGGTCCYVRTRSGNFAVPCYIPDYDLCKQMISNFAARAVRGEKCNNVPSLTAAVASVGATAVFMSAPLTVAAPAALVALVTAIIDFRLSRCCRRLAFCMVMWMVPLAAALAIPNAVLPQKTSIERCMAALQHHNDYAQVASTGDSSTLRGYELHIPALMAQADTSADDKGEFRTFRGWNLGLATNMPKPTFELLVANNLIVGEDTLVPPSALPADQSKSLSEKVCCRWTHPEGFKLTFRTYVGIVHQAGLKFDVYRWEGERNGQKIAGIDYLAGDGNKVIGLRSSDGISEKSNATLRMKAAFRTLRKV